MWPSVSLVNKLRLAPEIVKIASIFQRIFIAFIIKLPRVQNGYNAL